jgi:hypothetical protein
MDANKDFRKIPELRAVVLGPTPKGWPEMIECMVMDGGQDSGLDQLVYATNAAWAARFARQFFHDASDPLPVYIHPKLMKGAHWTDLLHFFTYIVRVEWRVLPQ